MNKMQTLYAIDKVAARIFEDIPKVRRIGRESGYLTVRTRMGRVADKMMDTVIELSGITIWIDPRTDDEEILTDEEIYTEVREAITTDRQYAAESVMYWQSHGGDLKNIATMLKTDVDVLVDLLKEFTEADT
jgi:hypothetical protein